MFKRILFGIILTLIFCNVGWAGGTFTVTEAQFIVVSGNTLDTLGREMITPDSIRIVVTDSAGTELHDAWYEAADDQCVLNGNIITFFDQWEDINGAASIGIFSLVTTIASDEDQDNIDVFGGDAYVIIGVDESVVQTYNEVGAILDTIQDGVYGMDVNIVSIKDDLATADSLNEAMDGYDNATLTLYEQATDLYSGIATLLSGVNVSSVDADAIGVGDIETDAINADAIATDAFTSDELAVSFITEFLDSLFETRTPADTGDGSFFGKLLKWIDSTMGYADTSNFATIEDLAAETSDSTWMKDTTGYLEAGTYGLEATTGAAASISDAAMGSIADSVWDKAKADMYAVSEGAGDFIRDTLLAIIDTLQNFPARVDLIWDEDTTGHKTDPQMGYWITQGGDASISDADMIAMADTIWQRNIPDDTTAGTGFDTRAADLLFQSGDTTNWADIEDITDSINAILDTLQLQDDWVATEAYVQKLVENLSLGHGNRSENHINADVDSVFIFSSGSDTTGVILYIHIGGVAGGTPDSTRKIDK